MVWMEDKVGVKYWTNGNIVGGTEVLSWKSQLSKGNLTWGMVWGCDMGGVEKENEVW